MRNDKLYKCFDTSGGMAALYNKTLQITNATQMTEKRILYEKY